MQGKDCQDRNARNARKELQGKDQTKNLQTARRFFLPGANLKKYNFFLFAAESVFENSRDFDSMDLERHCNYFLPFIDRAG
jgi:hypothetical protein